MTFTSKEVTETATATLEDANAATDQGQFLNYEEAVTVNERLLDHTHRMAGNLGNTTFRSTRLLGGSDSNAIYGLAKTLSVMPGDKITAKVYAKYVDTSAPDVQQALLTFLTAIGTGGIGDPLIDGGSPGNLGGAIFPYADYLEREDNTGVGPEAYLNYLVFDRDFNFLNGGYKRLTTSARETGNILPEGVGHDVLTFEEGEIKITEPGFVYIYFSNENESRVEVFFDDFEVTHVKSPVVQTDDYYPFGLTFNSYLRENSVDDRIKFQHEKHIDDLNPGWDSFKWRNHQPDIGRFFGIDPMAGAFYYNSPYAFSENKVTTHVELEGLEAFFIHGTVSGADVWTKDLTEFIRRELTTNKSVDVKFSWDYMIGFRARNWVFNEEEDRAKAAKGLMMYVMRKRVEGERIEFVRTGNGATS